MNTAYRWRIFLANLEPVVGSEQGSTRPVLVISEEAINQILPVVNMLPITSRKPGRTIYANEILLEAGTGNLNQESLILCYQIRTLYKQRLKRPLGEIDDPDLREHILKAVCFQLGILH